MKRRELLALALEWAHLATDKDLSPTGTGLEFWLEDGSVTVRYTSHPRIIKWMWHVIETFAGLRGPGKPPRLTVVPSAESAEND